MTSDAGLHVSGATLVYAVGLVDVEIIAAAAVLACFASGQKPRLWPHWLVVALSPSVAAALQLFVLGLDVVPPRVCVYARLCAALLFRPITTSQPLSGTACLHYRLYEYTFSLLRSAASKAFSLEDTAFEGAFGP